MANLQKIRELKAAGIEPSKKKKALKAGEMDYGREIPFEKPAPAGFFDTSAEDLRLARDKANETDAFRLTLLNKIEGDRVAEELQRDKRDKQKKLGALGGVAASSLPSLIARELEDDPMSLRPKRSKLSLPAPSLSDAELEELVRLGHRGAAAAASAAGAGGGLGFDDSGLGSVVTGALLGGNGGGAGAGGGGLGLEDDGIASTVGSMAAALLAKRASAAAAASVTTAAQRREALLEEAEILAKLNRQHQNPLLAGAAKARKARGGAGDGEAEDEEEEDDDDDGGDGEAEVLEDGTVVSRKQRHREVNLQGGTGFGGITPFANAGGSAKDRGLASFFSSAAAGRMDQDGGDDEDESASVMAGSRIGGGGGATAAGLGLTFRDGLGLNRGDAATTALPLPLPLAGQKRKAPHRGSSAASGFDEMDDSASVGAGSSFTAALNGNGFGGSASVVGGFGASALANKHFSSSISLALASLPAPRNSYQLQEAPAVPEEDEEDDSGEGVVGPASKRRKLDREEGSVVRDRSEEDEEEAAKARAAAELEFRKLSTVVQRQRMASSSSSSSLALPRPLVLPQGEDEVLFLTPTAAALAEAIDKRAANHPNLLNNDDAIINEGASGAAPATTTTVVQLTSKMLGAAESLILEEAALLLKNDAVKEPVS